MGRRLDPSFSVLHALRVKGRADRAALATATGLPDGEVNRILGALESTGQVSVREGRSAGWSLTPEGRDAHSRALATEWAGDGGAADAIHQAYRRFLALDEPFKGICTAWQMRDLGAGAPNDHTDPGYDRAVIERLTAVHREVVDIVDDLDRVAARYGPYRPRLEQAHSRLRAGDLTALTTPLTESYHDVWMELHEDLLVTLGVERREGVI